MISLAVDGLTGLSFLPLRMLSFVGGVLLCVGLASLFLSAVSLEVAIMLSLAGVNLLGLGLVGEYVGRIHERLQGRPNYMIAERVGFSELTEFGTAGASMAAVGRAKAEEEH